MYGSETHHQISVSRLTAWNNIHAVVLLLGIAFFVLGFPLYWVLLLSFLSFTGLILMVGFSFWKSYANWVTTIRLGLLFVAFFQMGAWLDTWVLAFIIPALMMDGLDGYLARKYNQQSHYGAYFDMETDAFYVAVLSLWWWSEGVGGWWMAGLAALRYVYALAIRLPFLPQKQEKSSRFAKTIAVVLMVGLLFPFGVSVEVSFWLLLVITLLTVYSFGLSFFSRFR